MEEWKDIAGYEGKYQVSNWGRIKSLNYKRSGKERILKLYNDKYGYKVINLHKNGKPKLYKIHRLVAITFIPNPNNYPVVNHKDENKANNYVDNLEWCTQKYNINYGTAQERISKSLKGKRTGSENPTARKIKCITTGEIFECILDAERKYNIEHSSIIKCCRGKQKSAGKHPVTGEKLVWEYIQ